MMISLDGSYGEGGGQMVRTALALSVLTNQPFKITDIRKGRCTPGLKAQHLQAIRALQGICGATVIGAKEGSMEISFAPDIFTPKDLNINIGTAGSITLLLQALLPPLIFAEKRTRIRLTGELMWMSMPIDYFTQVVIPSWEDRTDWFSRKEVLSQREEEFWDRYIPKIFYKGISTRQQSTWGKRSVSWWSKASPTHETWETRGPEQADAQETLIS